MIDWWSEGLRLIENNQRAKDKQLVSCLAVKPLQAERVFEKQNGIESMFVLVMLKGDFKIFHKLFKTHHTLLYSPE